MIVFLLVLRGEGAYDIGFHYLLCSRGAPGWGWVRGLTLGGGWGGLLLFLAFLWWWLSSVGTRLCFIDRWLGLGDRLRVGTLDRQRWCDLDGDAVRWWW